MRDAMQQVALEPGFPLVINGTEADDMQLYVRLGRQGSPAGGRVSGYIRPTDYDFHVGETFGRGAEAAEYTELKL
jgi:hypothetical protein